MVGPQVTLMEVTPEMAYEWLANHNTDNRKFRAFNLARLVGIILRDQWHLTPDVVAFDENGVLLNGQHRLQAIFDTGKTLPLMVGRNFQRESFVAIDVGARRSTADVLDIPQKHAEVATNFARMLNAEGGMVTPEVVRFFYEKFAKQMQALDTAFSGPKRGINPAGARAAVILRLNKHPNDKEYLLSLYGSVCRMALADAPPMASAYVKQCMEMDKGGRFSLRKNDYLVTLRAWVAFDPAKSHVGRITIKDPAAMMREVREEVRKQIA